MGAVETMDDFFEKLNAGDREGAVALMDERTEMRVHVGDRSRRCAGSSASAAGSCAATAGLKMIPGDARDMGNTYEADMLVVRPGAPSQHLDATFRVEAGKITVDQPRARASGRHRRRSRCGRGRLLGPRSAGRAVDDLGRRGDRDDDLVADRDLVRVLDLLVGGQQLIHRQACTSWRS